MAHRTRWVTVAVAIVGGVQLAGAPPAAAVPGLERTSGFSEDNTQPIKTVKAQCKAGKEVIGGGAFVDDQAASTCG